MIRDLLISRNDLKTLASMMDIVIQSISEMRDDERFEYVDEKELAYDIRTTIDTIGHHD